jgi:hypothetical protein
VNSNSTCRPHRQILKVDVQRNEAQLWFLREKSGPVKPYKCFAVETGVEFSNHRANYIGTALFDGGEYVLHYFQLVDYEFKA